MSVVMSAWLPWILAFVILVVLPVALRFAEDHPRNDDPPDTGEGERPAIVLRTA